MLHASHSHHPITKLLIGLVWAASAPSALALQPLITDDTGTQGLGGYQLEAAWNEDRSHDNLTREVRQSLPLTATYGVSEHLDVFINFTPTRLRDGASGTNTAGPSNPALGAKWRFLEHKESGWSLGLKPQIALPVSRSREAAQLGAGKTSMDVVLMATHEASWGALHVNLGANRSRYLDTTSQPNTRHLRLSAAPVYSLSETLKLAADVGVQKQWSRGLAQPVRESFVLLGAIYSPSQQLDLAVGLVRRSDHQDPRVKTHSATAGVTWRF